MGTAVFATAGIGPWFIKNARSTSGELKLFTWPDYSKPEVINAFEKETGIKVKVTNYSSNQECMNKLRAARATGFDIAQPSLTEYELHMEYDLYQEIDEKKSQIWITWNRPGLYRHAQNIGTNFKLLDLLIMGQDVEIVDVSMKFGSVHALHSISVHIRAGEFFSFLGPSGCGKTTLLRLISGFMEPTKGQIRIHGVNMQGVGPNKRPTAMIFQNLALFPLMNVAENIGFGLEVRGVSRKKRMKKIEELLELVELPGASYSRISDLSGGQKQRVAIARALAVEPAVLLLDEPLSALDLKLRKHMRAELRKIQRCTGVTFIYITHDQGEALTMSDRVGVMSMGRLEQVAEPDVIYNSPSSSFVASFVGETNMIPGTVTSTDSDIALVKCSLGNIFCINPHQLSSEDQVTVFLRPETIFITNGSQRPGNTIFCKILSSNFEGSYVNVRLLAHGGQNLILRVNNDGTCPKIEAGQEIHISFKPQSALLLPSLKTESNKTIWSSIIVTATTLALCYPISFYLAQMVKKSRIGWMMIALIIPYWINELLRIFAWQLILSDAGILNHLMIAAGLLSEPINFRAGNSAVIIGMIYAYIIFMVFPLYNVMENLDRNQIDAARDLGGGWFSIHYKVVIPHAKPGIAVGCIMTFMLAAGSIAAPQLLGSPSSFWFTEIIYTNFETANWNQGAAYAAVLAGLCLAFVFLMLKVFNVSLKDLAG